jgi:hypothetical protein
LNVTGFIANCTLATQLTLEDVPNHVDAGALIVLTVELND